MSTTFAQFDPLRIDDPTTEDESIRLRRMKKNIQSVLYSYTGWYDPFAELVQNALDSVDKRARQDGTKFARRLSIRLDMRSNTVTVSDNGVGLNETAFKRFLAPHESFKDDGLSRGSKGVGATYIAYGFNYIRIDTKTKEFSASGEMENARNWLDDPNPSYSP